MNMDEVNPSFWTQNSGWFISRLIAGRSYLQRVFDPKAVDPTGKLSTLWAAR
jgi:hypothetical protein